MANKKTSKQILIELGFDVQVKDLEKKLQDSQQELKTQMDQMAKQAKVLQNAFDLLKIDPKKVIDGNSFEEGFDSLRSYLKSLENSHYIVFKNMTDDVIEYQRAIGGAAYELGTITQNGINSKLLKSEAAKDPRSAYSSLRSGLATVKEQTERSTINSSALGGNKTEKELLKDSIADALKDDNDKISKFLSENIENLDNYISKIKTEYDSNGTITKAWVDFQIDEYQRMSMELQRVTGTLANGMDFSAFTRTGQSVTTKKTDTYSQEKKDLQEYNNILQKQISIYKELNSVKEDNGYKKILTEQNSELEKQKTSLKQNISNQEELNRLEKEYNTEISKISEKKNVSEDADKINEAVKAKKELLKAETDLYKLRNQKADTDTIQEQSDYVNKLSKSLKEAESAQLSNGQAVSESTKYREQANKADEQAAATQRQLSNRYKESKISLESLSESIKKTAVNVFQYNIAWNALDRVDDVIVASIEKVKELDQAITDIRLVTGETHESARQMVNDYADLAIQLGTTTQEVVDGSLEWLRQGKTAEETSELLKQSTMLSKLGAIEASDATEKLTAVMNGYKLSVEDASNVVDKLVGIDLIAATSTEELATALQYVSQRDTLNSLNCGKLLRALTTNLS